MPKITEVTDVLVTDVFGEYKPTIQCQCIDHRTLTNINNSLKILYNDKTREQRELKTIVNPSQIEIDAMNINDLITRRTESLMDTLKEIKICKEEHK